MTWKGQQMIHDVDDLPTEGSLPSLDGATGWLNSSPLTPAGLRGKVVLIDFCTYTCVNWIRTLPYLRAWNEKYKQHGLAMIGVHTPEFAFEHDLDNIRESLQSMQVDYPVAVDNNYAIWNAFNNHYWPALYFADTEGKIRHHHFGEGQYEQSERVIQQLLTEAGRPDIDDTVVSVKPRGIEVAADWSNLQSPETYLGYERAANFASPGNVVLNARTAYIAPPELRLNTWALSGDWTIARQAAVLNEASGKLSFRFHARDLNLVMGPATKGNSVQFRVRIDQQQPGASAGSDIDVEGNGIVAEQRLYQLIRQPKPIADRQFEIEFFGSDVQAVVFTFG